MITQGSNLPIYFSNIPISLDSINDISVFLCTKDGVCLKYWGKDDVTVSEGGIIAPVTQAESMRFPEGRVYAEIKFTDITGTILPGIRAADYVSKRDDRTPLSGEQPQNLRYVDIDCSGMTAEIGAVVGASAYEVAVKNGFEGTEEEWLESLRYDHSDEFAAFAEQVRNNANTASEAAQMSVDAANVAANSASAAMDAKNTAEELKNTTQDLKNVVEAAAGKVTLSEKAAAESEKEAKKSETAAGQSAANAADSAGTAVTAKNEVENAKNAAELAAGHASTSEANAKESEAAATKASADAVAAKEEIQASADQIAKNKTDISELKSDLSDKVPKKDYAPETKTESMTQPVGKDENGKLWTAPGSVSSVNGKTGAVVLTAEDVHALPDDTVIPTVPTNVSAFTNDAGYLTEHQDISGKLDADKLTQAVNYALEQAKTSGEFDGQDGHTPVKGVDYLTDADKAEMVSAVIAQLPVYAGEVV